MNERNMSPSEERIMKIVWDAKEPIATPDIITILKTKYRKAYARTTVVTFIKRLEQKGYVTTYRKGRVSYVVAMREEKAFLEAMINQINAFWFHGNPSELLETLLKNRKLSKKEKEKLRSLLFDE